MTTKIVILTAFFINCNGLSIGVSDNVNHSVKNIGDLFPDWVPFKNKHGDELGEFIPITKSKVKKRLAHPMNFILRAVAEPDDDYYDKGQGGGGGDSEDNYENKDWSDLHRPLDAEIKPTNHTEISDIDGVIEVLVRSPENDIAEAINDASKLSKLNSEIMRGDNEPEDDESDEKTTEAPPAEETLKKKKDTKNTSEEEFDYDDVKSEKEKIDPAEDVSENEAKKEAEKARILDAVDELKERHAEESRSLSEKVEEEMYKEEFERNIQHPVEIRDKYQSLKKYNKATPDYDEYDDKHGSLNDKYKSYQIRSDTTVQPKRTTTPKEKIKFVESNKPSVFRNPRLYMVYDDVEETTIGQNGPKQIFPKYSAQYTSTSPTDNYDDRISLVPEDAKEGEPTLFFAKKTKSRRRRIKTTPATSTLITESTTREPKRPLALDAVASDSRADTVETVPSSTGYSGTDIYATSTGTGVTGTGSDVTASGSDVPTENDDETTSGSDVTAAGIDTTASGSDVTTYSKNTENSIEDTHPTNTEKVTDVVPAHSGHVKKQKSADYHNEKGGGRHHDSEHFEEHEESGKKAYEGHHEDTKTAIGHHDKDNHLGKYEDHGGVDKHHNVESGHYGDHHHEEHGKKHAEYEESGKHSKGHNTKGSHDVHKKEEYEKKVEFFEEDGDSAEEEKHGGFNEEKGHAEGGKFNTGNLKAGHHHHAKGELGHYENGGHSNKHKGYKQSDGHDSHGKHGGHFLQKAGKDAIKKWLYHHGSPARTANLVVIDRRADQLFHGPQYYG